MPCCAIESAFTTEHQQNQGVSEKSGHHEQGDDCCGHCSPFYTCGTCVGFVLAAPLVYPSGYLACEPSEQFSLYLQSALQGLPASIWQPPRIG
ncbi:hypothetical protein [Chitinophaga horti]|uniref:hypothetical protein n=1 Tax=Chitinophaga horti TaxID=2920382 RepID=UPI003D818448